MSGPKWTEQRRAAHYKAMAAAAKNQKMFPGGGGTPKKPGCGKKTAQVVVLFTSIGMSALVVLVDRWI